MLAIALGGGSKAVGRERPASSSPPLAKRQAVWLLDGEWVMEEDGECLRGPHSPPPPSSK